jgi:hypothetical protein
MPLWGDFAWKYTPRPASLERARSGSNMANALALGRRMVTLDAISI